jgi:DNA-directed RNA polymerase specialized sigma24 family protein
MFTSKHNPYGEGSKHLDNVRLESLIGEYQAKGDAGSLGEIVRLTQTRALTLIRFHKTARYAAEDELLSDINFKLMRAVGKFDAAKGSAFTFVSRVASNALCTAVSRARATANRFVELDESVTNNLHTHGESQSRDVIEDLTHRIRLSVKAAITDSIEQDVQRWFVASFCEDGFESRRHECANAAMAVYNLSRERSRELYDLTMLEVRRVMFDDLPPRQPIAAGRLVGTRGAWMIRYRPLLNDAHGFY